MKPRRIYNMVPSGHYSNPVFKDSSPSGNQSKTDPLPFAAKFEPLTQSLLPKEPNLPGPPTAIPYPTSTADSDAMASTSPVSPISPEPSTVRFSSRSSVNSTLSLANSTAPILEKRPSRFQSDFSHLRKVSLQRSPDPAFQSHRRHFSDEATRYRTSAFREEVLEEDDDESNNGTDSANKNGDRTVGEITSTQFKSVPLGSAPAGLGLRYVQADEGAGTKSGSIYSNLPPDDDDDSFDEKIITKSKPKINWLSITILLLCIYSTIGSIFFFLIAAIKPRYGTKISTTSSLKPQDAQLISAILAKTIELSFVSVFVSFLGQVLSRRALMTGSKGVNIAELSMRSWVTQPGTLLTHTSSVRFAGLTFLGALSLTATVFASFYTTAADTLVSPKLAWGDFKARNLTGLAYTQYANSTYRSSTCKTVISDAEDPIYNGYFNPVAWVTCDAILSAGRGYRDLSDWNEQWAEGRGRTYSDAIKRPAAPTSLDLVNYAGAWMHVSGQNGINKATLAMPHPGIISSTRNSSLNGILQPEEAGSGYGSFIVKASVPNPVVDVTCSPVDAARINWYIAQSNFSDLTRNGTFDPKVQQLFNFTNDPELISPLSAPRFGKAPVMNNTVVSGVPASSSLYLLTRTPRSGESYVLCGITSFITPNCSSEFQAFESGGNATVNCDIDNELAFKEDLRRHNVSTLEYPVGTSYPVQDSLTSAPDFSNIAFNVFLSLSLNTGVSDGNASISHFLSQLALDTPTSNLNPGRPSLAEALAVLLGNAMVTSAADSVFTTYFAYNKTTPLPVKEYYNAQLQAIEYTSGAGSGWKPLFYVVLAGVLVMNIFCLVYFSCVRNGFVTDWTEVQNLFCITMDGGVLRGANAKPPVTEIGGEKWKGTGGTGPMGGQYKVGFWFTEKAGRWYVTDELVDGKGAKATGYERMV
ncbi:hypothetical protein H072_4274 [Dactylellina haptotyla CBS 200.50]|uniref:Uncharacterized protein n=1 Tax=Dactylellina haptotyla (strain CBS 200.50) TaxID=1284197 RepID=S8BQT9_DACHA|nr:hypothetical protein H072_4274 [Dactylellina haptotyla CBS 200.50]